jgi:ATP-dependent Clp protease ATP-binding subunit ClpC
LPKVFDRYSESARRVIFFGRYAALQEGSKKIFPKHLILGVIYELHRNKRSLETQFRLHENEAKIREALEFAIMHKVDPTAKASIPLDDASKRVLAFAVEEAGKLDHYSIEPEHLILGTLRERGPNPEILKAYGIELDRFREWFRNSYSGLKGAPKDDLSISLIGTILTVLGLSGVIWLALLLIKSW